MSDHRATTETEFHRLQSTRQRQAQGSSAEVDTVSSRQDPLAQVTDRIAAIDAVSGRAAMLSPVSAQRSNLAQRSLLHLQRQHGNRHVQRALAISRRGEGDVDNEVAPQVEQAIERKRGNGQTLDSGVRAHMEPAFGVDFSGVRTHTDKEADTLNQAVNARAFTTGQDIFFRQGEYDTSSSRGRELLAHELTHVVQQTGVVSAKLGISQPDDAHEREADEVARQLKDGQFDKNSEEKPA